jgi:hypothetical protein
MESIDSQILCRAVNAPIVKSVMDMSLLSLAPFYAKGGEGTYSIEPTRPTMLRCLYASFCSSVIRPVISCLDTDMDLETGTYRPDEAP